MSRTICSSAILLILSSFHLNPVRAENYAFLVAVQDYDVKHLRPLKFARNDVLELAAVLKQSGFKADNVKLLHDDLQQLSSRRYIPEAKKIRRELDILLARIEPDDTLIVAFAGHGVQFKGESENYFCPADANLEEADRESLISFRDLYATLKDCPARKKLLVVDACRNDPQSSLSRSREKVKVESRSRPQLTPLPQGLVALFSCAPGQQAFEWPDLKHGIFFHHFLHGWRGKADNGDGKVTLDELVAYTKSATSEFADQKLAAIQTPRQLGFFEGEWIIQSQKESAPVPTSTPAAASPSPSASLPPLRENFQQAKNGALPIGWNWAGRNRDAMVRKDAAGTAYLTAMSNGASTAAVMTPAFGTSGSFSFTANVGFHQYGGKFRLIFRDSTGKDVADVGVGVSGPNVDITAGNRMHRLSNAQLIQNKLLIEMTELADGTLQIMLNRQPRLIHNVLPKQRARITQIFIEMSGAIVKNGIPTEPTVFLYDMFTGTSAPPLPRLRNQVFETYGFTVRAEKVQRKGSRGLSSSGTVVVVGTVVPGSVAVNRLKVGDVIVKVGSFKVFDVAGFESALSSQDLAKQFSMTVTHKSGGGATTRLETLFPR